MAAAGGTQAVDTAALATAESRAWDKREAERGAEKAALTASRAEREAVQVVQAEKADRAGSRKACSNCVGVRGDSKYDCSGGGKCNGLCSRSGHDISLT